MAAGAPAIDLDTIAAAALFGHKSTSGDPNGEALNAPETTLELQLTGIVSDSNGGRERALIRADDSLAEQAFARGDEVMAGTRLHAIHRTHVVLDRGGRFEKLSLPLDKAPTNQTSDEDESLPRGDAAFQAVRDEVAADPSAIQQYVNIQGYYRDDRLQGFRVYPTNKGKPYFERLGLPPGTLIRSVNGLPLDGSVNWDFVGQELAQAVHLELVVGRERQRRLSLKIR
ncbi:general secretion pathway protein C [Salinisphaera sp. PC39]